MIKAQPDANGWKFRKELSIDTVIAAIVLTLGIGGPLILTYNAIDKRIVIQETLREEDTKKQVTRDADVRAQRTTEEARADKIAAAIQSMQIDIAKLITIQTQGKR